MFKDESKILVKGVNINKIYKVLLKNQIEICKINRHDYKTLTFYVKNKNIKKVFALLNNPCYNVKVEKFYGFYAIKNFIKQRLGIIVALIFFCMATVLNNFYISSIKVYGNEKISTSQIIKSLEKSGVFIGKSKSKINLQQCEEILLDDIDQISLASIIIKGNCLIVNVKEKLLDESIINNQNFSCHIATFGGTITQLEILEGTPLVKVGDSVKQGDIIVAGYYLDESGQKVKCNAKAKVKAKVWFSSSKIFKEEETVFVRTGKTICQSNYYFSKTKIFSQKVKNTFNTFEQKYEESFLFKNNILPLKKCSTIYYETKSKVVKKNFDDYKQNILESCYKTAKQKIPNQIKDYKSFDVIEKIDGGYVISAYYETEIYI